MNTTNPKEIILRAIEAFNRRMLVVSPRFEILAIRGQADEVQEADVVGQKCYKLTTAKRPVDEKACQHFHSLSKEQLHFI